MAQNLSEQYLKLSEENEPKADDVDAIIKPIEDSGKEKTPANEDEVKADDPDAILAPMDTDKDKIVEQEESEVDLPKALEKVLGRLAKKPNATKIEMQDALIQALLGQIKELPAANRLLRQFVKTAVAIVLKGEDMSGESDDADAMDDFNYVGSKHHY